MSADRQEEERTIIRDLRAEGRRLLNDWPQLRPELRYEYRTANEAEERIKLQRFIDWLIGPACAPE